jgi:hypothetical protein
VAPVRPVGPAAPIFAHETSRSVERQAVWPFLGTTMRTMSVVLLTHA